jgi:FkbM family methyltransferase
VSQAPAFARASGLKPETIEIVDIGARTEGAPRWLRLVQTGLARVTGFEPDPEARAALERRYPAPHRFLAETIGRGGPGTLHLTNFPGCTSLYEPDPAVIDLFTSIGTTPEYNFHVHRTMAVETRRLDDVAECPAPDFLKLDIQGAELDALMGAEAKLAATLAIECEVEFVPLYKNQPLFGDVQSWLAQRGFILHKLIDIAGRCYRPMLLNANIAAPMSQVLWADAVFVRHPGQLDALTSGQLVKLAALLHEAYGSFDLVVHLLRAHDARAGGDTAARYMKAMMAAGTSPGPYMNLKLQV